MALVAKISGKSGKSVRTVKLRKGVNVLAAEADAIVSVIDEATGKAVDAQLVRLGGEVRVSVPDSYFSASDGALAAIDGAQENAPVGGAGETPPAEGSAGGEAAGGAGGGSGALYGVLGAVALGGLAAGAAGGGGGGGSKTPADTTPPGAPTGLALAAADDTGTSNSDRITSQTSALTITGTAEANATVTVLNGSTTLGTATADASGNFTLDVSLAAGTHSITATAKDAAGNTGPASTALSITVDTTAPAAPTALALAAADDTGGSSTDGVTSQTSGLTITGTAEANAVVTLRDGATVLGTATANAQGQFTFDAALAAGAHSITATAADAAGNVGTASAALAITVDTTAPTVAITSSLATLLGAQTATLTFTFSEAPVGFAAGDVTVSGGAISNLVVSPNNPNVYTATLTPTGNVAGNLSISVAGAAFTDTAGNASAASTAFNVAFDPGAQGQAIDGYIANALVFRDADNDGVWDHEAFTDANGNGLFDAGETFVDANGDNQFTAEYVTRTDAQGNFSGLFGSGRIVLTPLIVNGVNQTKDISTGQAFTGKLAAPDGATVVTPLTTLVEAVAGAGATAAQVAAAQAQVKAALGLSASVDLNTLDPIAAVASGTGVTDAVAVQKAATQVANILAVVGSAAQAAGATGGKEAGVAAATSAIAAQIAGGGTVDLTSAATIQQVAQAAATTTGSEAGTAIAAQAAALGASLANVNTVIAQASSADPVSTLNAVVAAQIVAQENLAADVSAAIANEQTLDSSQYEGAALAEQVDDASGDVEVLIPAEPAPPGAPGTPGRPVIDDDGARVSAAEAADGVVVTVPFGGAGNIAAGDTLRLLVGETVVGTVTLTAGDIAAGGVAVTLSAADLGADGAKSITAGFVSSAGLEGNLSLPAVFTLDTAAPAAPTGLALDAADDSGVPGDGVTRSTDSLRINGAAEAGSTVTLRDGATVLGTATADLDGRFTFTVSLAEGTHGLTATATDAAGNVSPASAAFAITVDTAGPAAPSGIVPSEGGILTGVEAADGTVITGSTEAGSTVTFTFVNGANTLVKDAELTGTAFALSLTQEEIEALGEGPVSYTATAIDAAGNVGSASIAGRYVYNTQPFAAANIRVDTPDLPVDTDDDRSIGVTPLRGGGFAVHWLVDGDEDGTDTIAIQRFGADGARTGDIVLLQGIDQNLLQSESEDIAYDITLLEGGGFALTYSLTLEEGGRQVNLTQGPNAVPLSVPIVGLPDEVVILNAPANATYSLSGVDSNGATLTVGITAENGVITFDQATLDQFLYPNRLTLVVNGMTQGQQFGAFIDVAKDVTYDLDVAPVEVEVSRTVLPNGVGVLSVLEGRPEAFHIDAFTGNLGVRSIQITPMNGPGSINFGGIPNVSVTAAGVIIINNVQPDANGDYRIPQQILDSAGEQDFQAILVIQGLTAGSTLTGSVTVREAIPVVEGVFVQTFDANGVALGDAGERIDIAGAEFVPNDDQVLHVTALAGGGFAVNWIVDSNGDTDPDLLGVQRFAADGSKLGEPVLLTGFSTDVLDLLEEDGAFDLQALEGGGYALAYTQTLESLFGVVAAPGFNPSISVVGRPTGVQVLNSPVPVTLTLSGTGVDGQPKSIFLGSGSGFFEITSDMTEGFLLDNRFTLNVGGLTQAQTATIGVQTQKDQVYDRAQPLIEQVSERAVIQNPNGTTTGLIAVAGQAEAFRIDASSGTVSGVNILVNVQPGMNFSLPQGATRQPNGTIVIANVTADAQGFYRIPEQLLNDLQGHDYGAFAVVNGLTGGSTLAAAVLGRQPVELPQGVFVQTFGADGAALGDAARLDGGVSLALLDGDDDGGVTITPLAGGGYTVSWLVDADGNGEAENIAIQRFAADGSKAGDVVVLKNFAEGLLDQIDEVGSYDFQALDNGGYVLTYSLELESSDRSFSLSQQFNQLNIVGRPNEIFVGSPPPGATFLFSAMGPNGVAVNFSLVPENGFLRITDEMLGQLAVDNRGVIVVSGLTQGQTITGYIETLEDVSYEDAPRVDTAVTGAILPGGFGVIAVNEGRPEAFRVDAVAGTPTSITMVVVPIWGGQNINVQGIPNVFVAPNGTINIGNPVKDADGFYRVPQQILDQIDDNDLQAFLVLGGLTEGSPISGTVTVSVGTELKEGLFVQTFGPDGSFLFDGAEIIGTDAADGLIGDTGGDVIRGLGGNDQLSGGAGDDVLIGGPGSDIMTGGDGADLFMIDAPASQTLSLADLITDFQQGVDAIRLPNGVAYADVLIAQGDPSTNGAAALDSLIIHAASGDILARLANTDAATVTQASFM